MSSFRFSFLKRVRLSVFQTLGFGIFILSILFFPIKSRAAVTDFYQTSQSMEVNIMLPTIISLLPDPSLADEPLVTMMLLPFGEVGDQLGDTPLFLHLFRRNPDVNTLSQILFTLLVEDDNGVSPLPFIPVFSESGWVVGITGGSGNNNPNEESKLLIAGVPLSTYDAPVGSSARAVLVDSSLPHLEFKNDTDLKQFEPPVAIEMPFLPHFYDFALPSGNNPLEFIMMGEIPAPDSSGDKLLAYFGARADIGADGKLTLTAVPLTEVGINLGSPPHPQDNRAASSSNILMGDYSRDGCADLAVLVDLQDPTGHDFLLMMKGKCDGSNPPFEPISAQNFHDLGANFAVFDLVDGDFNKDGHLDLGIVYSYPGINPADPDDQPSSDPSRIDIIEDAFGAFAVHSGPTLPAHPTVPLFADRLDCNVDFIDDIVVAGIEVLFKASTGNGGSLESIHSSDVICYLSDGQGGFPSQAMVYPKELIRPSISDDDVKGGKVVDVMLATTVGNIGCGTGWAGVSFFTVEDDNQSGQTTSGQGQAIGGGENCTDGIDNDGDQLIDCSDPDCSTFCQGGENCSDGQDNDGDGFADCSDPDCTTFCQGHEFSCKDKQDNDGDGNIDCQDSDCSNDGVCNPKTGAYTALFAEHSDCAAVASALAGGGDNSGGDTGLISGGGCISQMIPGSGALPWGSATLSLLPLLVLGGRRFFRGGMKRR